MKRSHLIPTQQALRWNLLFASGQSMPSGWYCSVKGESWSPRSLTSTATAPCSAYICSVVPKYVRAWTGPGSRTAARVLQ